MTKLLPLKKHLQEGEQLRVEAKAKKKAIDKSDKPARRACEAEFAEALEQHTGGTPCEGARRRRRPDVPARTPAVRVNVRPKEYSIRCG